MSRFRFVAGVAAVLLPMCAGAQQSATALQAALAGKWTGVLEYRDYSEPATSTKRVQLPTWLAVNATPEGLTLHYVYDDGPGKTVEENSSVALDGKKQTWRAIEAGHAAVEFQMSGLAALKDGRGVLVLNADGTESGKPAAIRETLTVRRNLLVISEETKPEGSAEFAFRHRYVFTRAEVPAVSRP